MSGFQTFSENELYMMLREWRESGVTSLHITCGPLIVYASYDFNKEIWRVHGIRRGRIMAGSLIFYSARYSLFRCVYGIMRTQGLESPEWESCDRHSFRYHMEYLNLISYFILYMRVKIQRGVDEGIFIQNLISHSYMKIKPVRPYRERTNGIGLLQGNAITNLNGAETTLPFPSATTLGMELGFVSEAEDGPN